RQPHAGQRLARLLLPFRGPDPRVDQGQLDVVDRVGPGQEVEGLEDESDFLVADPRQVVVAADLETHAEERADRLGAHDVLAGELVRENDDVGKRRIAGHELLVRHEALRTAPESPGVLVPRTAAPSLRSRMAW